jgi:hypothetical protein
MGGQKNVTRKGGVQKPNFQHYVSYGQPLIRGNILLKNYKIVKISSKKPFLLPCITNLPLPIFPPFICSINFSYLSTSTKKNSFVVICDFSRFPHIFLRSLNYKICIVDVSLIIMLSCPNGIYFLSLYSCC